jgi:hypothetical protein
LSGARTEAHCGATNASTRPLERVVGRRFSHLTIEHTQVDHLIGMHERNNIAPPAQERKTQLACAAMKVQATILERDRVT